MNQVLTFLDQHQIPYQLFRHPKVFTVAEGKQYKLNLPGVHTKNLFLRNKDKSRFFLYSLEADTRADLKALAHQLQTSRLSFASPDLLYQYLQLTPGSVSPFGLLHDQESRVEYLVSQPLWQADLVGFHPNDNSATLVLTQSNFRRYLSLINHLPLVLS